jgi:hypothetical protein
MLNASLSLRRFSLAALCSLAACGDGGTEPDPVPASLVAVSATTQTAVVGAAVPTPPVVRVLDDRGRAMAGVSVAFAVTAGAGTVAAASVPTDAQGQASVAWTLGTTAQENVLSATVPGLTPVLFSAQAGAAQPASLQKVAGDGQTGAVGSVLADSLAVRVLDAYGNGVPGVAVSFFSFAGTPSAGNVNTNAQGFAKTALMLTRRPATDTVHATATGLAPIKFIVTVVPGPPDSIYRMEGVDQSASAGRPLQVAPLVRVEDAYGNVVPGVPVTFTPDAGSGVAAPATVITDSLGRARTGHWTLGREGTNRLVVSAGTASTEYTATGYGVCTQTPYTLHSTVQKALSTTCRVQSYISDVYTVTYPAAQGVDFTVTSPAFTPEFAFMDAAGRIEMWAPFGSYGSVKLRVYAPAGAYQLATGVLDNYPNPSYQLSSSPADNVSACIPRLVIPDVTIQGEVRNTQCLQPDVFHVHIPFGGRIRATLTSSAFNPRLVVDARSGGHLTEAIGTGPGSTVQVTTTGFFNPLYQVYVWTQPGVTGAYTLTVERL